MSVDKLVDSTQLDTDLTSIANAIRTKGATSSDLAFPSGFVSAIQAIPTGVTPTGTKTINISQNGTTTEDITNYASVEVNTSVSTDGPIRFIDYDGTVLYSYSLAELANLTALPTAPIHSGLVFDGWNYTLAQIRTEATDLGACTIGAHYITDDNKTRLYCEFVDGALSFYLGITVKGIVTINWGDNSQEDTITANSETAVVYTQHTYSSSGEYVITIAPLIDSTHDCIFGFSGSSSLAQSCILRRGTATSSTNDDPYLGALKKVELGIAARISTYYAFGKCKNLKTITVPNNVIIPYSATGYSFYECFSLKAFVLPRGLGDNTICTSSFQECYSLTVVSIPNDITKFKNYVFQLCYSMKRVDVPSSVTSFDFNVFDQCEGLEEANLSNNLTSMSNSIFSSCRSLKKVNLPSSATSMGPYCFSGCYSLKKIIIPNSVSLQTMSSDVFFGTSLEKIIIPDTVTSIGSYAFYNCKCATEVYISTSATQIGTYAFQNCIGLSVVTVPSSVETISANAFNGNVGIVEYHFQKTSPPTLSNINAFNQIRSDCKMYVPYSSDGSILNAYKTANNWSNFATFMLEEPQ